MGRSAGLLLPFIALVLALVSAACGAIEPSPDRADPKPSERPAPGEDDGEPWKREPAPPSLGIGSGPILRRGERAHIPFSVHGFTGPVRVTFVISPAVGQVTLPEPTTTNGEIVVDVAKEAPLGEVPATAVAEDEAGHVANAGRLYFTVRPPIGTIDRTFANGGRLVVPGIPLTAIDQLYGCAPMFFLVGGASGGSLVAAAFERQNGKLVSTFGPSGTGLVTIPHDGGDGPVTIASDSLGKIYIAGGSASLVVARLSMKGVPLAVGTASLRDVTNVASVVVSGTDRVVACGTTKWTAANDAAFGCAAFAGSALDATFGVDGTWIADEAATSTGNERVVSASGKDGLTVEGVATNASGVRERVTAVPGLDGKGTTTKIAAMPSDAVDLLGFAYGGTTGGMRPTPCSFAVYGTAQSFRLAEGSCTPASNTTIPPAPTGLTALELVAVSRRTVAGSAIAADGRRRGVLGHMNGWDENAVDASETTWMTSDGATDDERFVAAFEEFESEWVYGVGSSNGDGLVMRFWR